GLSHKVDIFDFSFSERNCPVGVVITHGRGDQEPTREFGIDNNFSAGVQFLYEVTLGFGVSNDVVINMLLQLLACQGEILTTLSCGKNARVVSSCYFIIG